MEVGEGLGKHMAACGGWRTPPGGGGSLPILRLDLCTAKEAGFSIDAAHFGARRVFLPRTTNRLFVHRGAPLAPGPAYQWGPSWEAEEPSSNVL